MGGCHKLDSLLLHQNIYETLKKFIDFIILLEYGHTLNTY